MLQLQGRRADLFEKKRKQCIFPQIGESCTEQRDAKEGMNVIGTLRQQERWDDT